MSMMINGKMSKFLDDIGKKSEYVVLLDSSSGTVVGFAVSDKSEKNTEKLAHLYNTECVLVKTVSRDTPILQLIKLLVDEKVKNYIM